MNEVIVIPLVQLLHDTSTSVQVFLLFLPDDDFPSINVILVTGIVITSRSTTYLSFLFLLPEEIDQSFPFLDDIQDQMVYKLKTVLV